MNISLDHLVDRIRVPSGGDKVYNDQCVYSFDTPVRRRSCLRRPFLVAL